tara:strand:+ start:3642 stop:4859 length:1218 start_codon:yes stop_codon:yes gene_type:complete
MATITTTTTTTTEEDLPVDQQSIVITPSRNLDTLLSIQNDVSEDEADQISEIQLYNLIEPNKNLTIVTRDFDQTNKWIVIDWVTGHLNDSRLGFRIDEGSLTPKPNLIRQQLMQQQYGYSNNNNNRSTTVSSIDFQGEDSELDLPETLIKYFIKGKELNRNNRKTNGEDFFKALQEVMTFHIYKKINATNYADLQNLRLYQALLKCFMNPKRYIVHDKIQKIQNDFVKVGMRMNFTDNSKIVNQVLISQRMTRNGDGLWTIQIKHNLGLGYDPNVLNLYFVIMRLDHYNQKNSDITEALNGCYKDKKLKLDLIRLESGFLFESDTLSKELDNMTTTKKAGKKRGKFSRKQLKQKLMAELIGNDNNNNTVADANSKKKKKRRKPNPETGSSSQNPVDLTLLKALKF